MPTAPVPNDERDIVGSLGFELQAAEAFMPA